jgi:hypothetical protein
MATTGIFNGTNLLLKLDGTIIGHSTSCSMSLSMDTPEATTKDSNGFSEYIAGVKGGEISFEGLVDYSDSLNGVELFDSLLARTTLTCVFGTAESGDAIYTADGFLSSIEMSGEMESAVTYSGSITISGAITKSTN